MGMKELEDTLLIVDKTEALNLDKNNSISVFSELTDNKYLIKYKGQISDKISKHYKKEYLNTETNKLKFYDKIELGKSGLNKKINVPSAVHIAAAISSYARILINEFKNIPGNPCIMSDTDSVFLTKPLPEYLINKKLGYMKLENEALNGIFIRKKLYYIENTKKEIIIKSSGLDSSRLNYKMFIKLLNGGSVEVERTSFNKEWESLNINVKSSNVVVQGLTGKIKTIYNTPDVNFKTISFPLNYNLIPHPNHSDIIVNVDNNKNKDNNIKLSTPSVSVSQDESDFYLIFSKLEIILFLISVPVITKVMLVYKLL